MISPTKFPLPFWGLLLAGLSVAPIPQQNGVPGPPERKEAPRPPAMSEIRLQAAVKQYDLTWQYYQQNRVDTRDVYLWSRLLLDARQAVGKGRADRIRHCEEHLEHMKKLEALIKKIRRLGFGRSSDVGASEYFRIEARVVGGRGENTIERFTVGLRTRQDRASTTRARNADLLIGRWERRSPDRPLAPGMLIRRSAYPGGLSDREPLSIAAWRSWHLRKLGAILIIVSESRQIQSFLNGAMAMRRRRYLAAEVLEQRALLSSLSYSLTTDRPVYQVGQTVQFTFRETNTGTQPVTVQVAPTDFTVSQNGRSIWQSDPGNASQPPTTETLLPGQSVVQTAAWDGRTSYSLGGTSSLAAWQINNFGTFSVSNLNGPPGTSAAFQITNPITSSLTTDKQVYRPGEPIQATFTEVNTASQPITTFFSLPFAAFDAYQNGKPLWINAYPQVIKAFPVVFAAGQTITTSEILNPATGAHSGVFDNLTGTFDATYGPQGDPTEYSTPFQIVDPGNGPPSTSPPVTMPPVTAPPVSSPPVSSPPVTCAARHDAAGHDAAGHHGTPPELFADHGHLVAQPPRLQVGAAGPPPAEAQEHQRGQGDRGGEAGPRRHHGPARLDRRVPLRRTAPGPGRGQHQAPGHAQADTDLVRPAEPGRPQEALPGHLHHPGRGSRLPGDGHDPNQLRNALVFRRGGARGQSPGAAASGNRNP